MNKLTFAEIETILNSDIFSENDHNPKRWMLEDIASPDHVEEGEFKEIFKQLGKYELVDWVYSEGSGDDYWVVYHFIDHDVYIKFNGWESSYSGTEFEKMKEVKKITKTIDVYK